MSKLIQCIPNFSEGRDKHKIKQLEEVASSVKNCSIINVESDENYNRCVISLIGSPEAIEEVSFLLVKKATEIIDMREHSGVHPRIGATDVLPFVPCNDTTMEECIEISKRVAKRIWDELQIPSFLYESSASNEERKNLSNIREGEFEGMPSKLLKDEWKPDFGERKIHKTAGVIAIGARMPLVVFNINLNTSNERIAKQIASEINCNEDLSKSCKAFGAMLDDRGLAQVSINMTNFEDVPLYYAFEFVKILAKKYNTFVCGSEIVGDTSAKALLSCAGYYLQLENFDVHKQILEYHLMQMNNDLSNYDK